MRLINDFFYIDSKETSDRGYRCKVHLNGEHSIYKAHFPGYPITPGVCIIQMCTEILELFLDKSLQLAAAKEVKFKKALSPVDRPIFVFTKVGNDNNGVIQANISIEDDGGSQYATLVFQYTGK